VGIEETSCTKKNSKKEVVCCRSDMDNGWNGTDLLNVLHVQARNRYVMNQMYNR
jgi:hypothetical protein